MSDPGIADTPLKLVNAAFSSLGVRDIAAFDRKTNLGRIASDAYANTLEAALSGYPWRFARATKRIYPGAGIGPNHEWTHAYRWPTGALMIHEVWAPGSESPVDFDVAYDDRPGQEGRRILTNTAPQIGRWVTAIPQVQVGDNPQYDADETGFADTWVLPAEEVQGASQGTDPVTGEPRFEVTDRTPCLTVECTLAVPPAAWPGHFRQAFVVQLAADMAMPATQDAGMKSVKDQEAQRAWAFAKSRDAQMRTPPKIDTSGILRARMGGSFRRR